ncbi:MAG: hypothetical protein FWH03_05510 [Firmicutes bacterium]|nr:hypothetical protein [Bacillota bacterium]
MPKPIFAYVTNLKEVIVGKKKLILRCEGFKKGLPQYCIRDSKFQEIFKSKCRHTATRCFEEYIKILENPHNPFVVGDFVYNKRGETKEDYDFYQVIKTTTTTVALRKVNTDHFTSIITGNTYVSPLKDSFIDEEIVSKKIEIIITDDNTPLVLVSYGIRSERGIYKKLEGTSVMVIPVKYKS